MAVTLLLLAPLASLFARRFTPPSRALVDAIGRDGGLPPPQTVPASGAARRVRSRNRAHDL